MNAFISLVKRFRMMCDMTGETREIPETLTDEHIDLSVQIPWAFQQHFVHIHKLSLIFVGIWQRCPTQEEKNRNSITDYKGKWTLVKLAQHILPSRLNNSLRQIKLNIVSVYVCANQIFSL